MKRKIEKHRFNKFVTRSNQLVFFVIFCQSSMRQHFVLFQKSKFAINQNVSINKNSKSSNSKNLKQHMFAKSISFCCFWFAREIDRFIILICKYFRDQNFHQNFHSRRIYLFFFFSHIFCFRIYFFTFIASVLNLSVSIVIRLIFESSSMNFFAMSIDKKNEYSFRNETWKKKIMLRTCFEKNFDKVLFLWRTCIEFNIWSIIKINIFILSHRMTESNFVYNQIFYICFVKLFVLVFSLRYSRVIM